MMGKEVSCLVLVLWTTACGSSLAPPAPLALTIVDPDGAVWTDVEAEVGAYLVQGAGCDASTWYQVGEDVMFVWFPDPGSSTFLVSGDLNLVMWGASDPTDARFLFGGEWSTLEHSANRLTVTVDRGQDCIFDPVDDYVCAGQEAPLDSVIEGDVGALSTVDRAGHAGSVSDLETGDDVCSTEAPGG